MNEIKAIAAQRKICYNQDANTNQCLHLFSFIVLQGGFRPKIMKGER